MCPSIVDGFSRSKETCLRFLSLSAEARSSGTYCGVWSTECAEGILAKEFESCFEAPRAEGILAKEIESCFEALRPVLRLLFASPRDESMSELVGGSILEP